MPDTPTQARKRDQQASPEHVQESTHLDVRDKELADDLLALLLIGSHVAGSSSLIQPAVCCCHGGVHLAARHDSSTAQHSTAHSTAKQGNKAGLWE